ncbi:MAG: hypothetical protein ACO1SX_13825 [Actinomycetota bacterium]
MPHIQVLSSAGLHHHASEFHAWEPGVYEFSDEPAYAGWLAGQCERGNVRIIPEPEPVAEPVAAPITPTPRKRKR